MVASLSWTQEVAGSSPAAPTLRFGVISTPALGAGGDVKSLVATMVFLAQLAERLVVVQKVTGSSPVWYPNRLASGVFPPFYPTCESLNPKEVTCNQQFHEWSITFPTVHRMVNTHPSVERQLLRQ